MQDSIKNVGKDISENAESTQRKNESHVFDGKSRGSGFKETHFTPGKRKGFIARFLERLAKDNNQTFGGKLPKCH